MFLLYHCPNGPHPAKYAILRKRHLKKRFPKTDYFFSKSMIWVMISVFNIAEVINTSFLDHNISFECIILSLMIFDNSRSRRDCQGRMSSWPNFFCTFLPKKCFLPPSDASKFCSSHCKIQFERSSKRMMKAMQIYITKTHNFAS